MKTLKTVLAENKKFSKLIKAVTSKVGIESIEDVNRHGIGGGFGGFIYYYDTLPFFKKYKKQILELAEDMAPSICEGGALELIQNFNCLSSGQYPNKKPNYTQTEIAQAIYSGKGENATQVQNAMAWFAAEEVCRMFEK